MQPPKDDHATTPERSAPDDHDLEAILTRRKFLVSVALSGLGAAVGVAACENASSCLSMVDPDATVCLQPDPDTLTDMPEPCLAQHLDTMQDTPQMCLQPPMDSIEEAQVCLEQIPDTAQVCLSDIVDDAPQICLEPPLDTLSDTPQICLEPPMDTVSDQPQVCLEYMPDGLDDAPQMCLSQQLPDVSSLDGRLGDTIVKKILEKLT